MSQWGVRSPGWVSRAALHQARARTQLQQATALTAQPNPANIPVPANAFRGSWTDTFRQTVLSQLIQNINQQGSGAGWTYIDYSAGPDRWDISKSVRRHWGINPVFDYGRAMSVLRHKDRRVFMGHPFLGLMRRVREVNASSASSSEDGLVSEKLMPAFKYFPSTAAILKPIMRAQDRAILCEKDPHYFARLQQYIGNDHRFKLWNIDVLEEWSAAKDPTKKTKDSNNQLVPMPIQARLKRGEQQLEAYLESSKQPKRYTPDISPSIPSPFAPDPEVEKISEEARRHVEQGLPPSPPAWEAVLPEVDEENKYARQVLQYLGVRKTPVAIPADEVAGTPAIRAPVPIPPRRPVLRSEYESEEEYAIAKEIDFMHQKIAEREVELQLKVRGLTTIPGSTSQEQVQQSTTSPASASSSSSSAATTASSATITASTATSTGVASIFTPSTTLGDVPSSFPSAPALSTTPTDSTSLTAPSRADLTFTGTTSSGTPSLILPGLSAESSKHFQHDQLLTKIQERIQSIQLELRWRSERNSGIPAPDAEVNEEEDAQDLEEEEAEDDEEEEYEPDPQDPEEMKELLEYTGQQLNMKVHESRLKKLQAQERELLQHRENLLKQLRSERAIRLDEQVELEDLRALRLKVLASDPTATTSAQALQRSYAREQALWVGEQMRAYAEEFDKDAPPPGLEIEEEKRLHKILTEPDDATLQAQIAEMQAQVKEQDPVHGEVWKEIHEMAKTLQREDILKYNFMLEEEKCLKEGRRPPEVDINDPRDIEEYLQTPRKPEWAHEIEDAVREQVEETKAAIEDDVERELEKLSGKKDTDTDAASNEKDLVEDEELEEDEDEDVEDADEEEKADEEKDEEKEKDRREKSASELKKDQEYIEYLRALKRRREEFAKSVEAAWRAGDDPRLLSKLHLRDPKNLSPEEVKLDFLKGITTLDYIDQRVSAVHNVLEKDAYLNKLSPAEREAAEVVREKTLKLRQLLRANSPLNRVMSHPEFQRILLEDREYFHKRVEKVVRELKELGLPEAERKTTALPSTTAGAGGLPTLTPTSGMSAPASTPADSSSAIIPSSTESSVYERPPLPFRVPSVDPLVASSVEASSISPKPLESDQEEREKVARDAERALEHARRTTAQVDAAMTQQEYVDRLIEREMVARALIEKEEEINKELHRMEYEALADRFYAFAHLNKDVEEFEILWRMKKAVRAGQMHQAIVETLEEEQSKADEIAKKAGTQAPRFTIDSQTSKVISQIDTALDRLMQRVEFMYELHALLASARKSGSGMAVESFREKIRIIQDPLAAEDYSEEWENKFVAALEQAKKEGREFNEEEDLLNDEDDPETNQPFFAPKKAEWIDAVKKVAAKWKKEGRQPILPGVQHAQTQQLPESTETSASRKFDVVVLDDPVLTAEIFNEFDPESETIPLPQQATPTATTTTSSTSKPTDAKELKRLEALGNHPWLDASYILKPGESLEEATIVTRGHVIRAAFVIKDGRRVGYIVKGEPTPAEEFEQLQKKKAARDAQLANQSDLEFAVTELHARMKLQYQREGEEQQIKAYRETAARVDEMEWREELVEDYDEDTADVIMRLHKQRQDPNFIEEDEQDISMDLETAEDEEERRIREKEMIEEEDPGMEYDIEEDEDLELDEDEDEDFDEEVVEKKETKDQDEDLDDAALEAKAKELESKISEYQRRIDDIRAGKEGDDKLDAELEDVEPHLDLAALRRDSIHDAADEDGVDDDEEDEAVVIEEVEEVLDDVENEDDDLEIDPITQPRPELFVGETPDQAAARYAEMEAWREDAKRFSMNLLAEVYAIRTLAEQKGSLVEAHATFHGQLAGVEKRKLLQLSAGETTSSTSTSTSTLPATVASSVANLITKSPESLATLPRWQRPVAAIAERLTGKPLELDTLPSASSVPVPEDEPLDDYTKDELQSKADELHEKRALEAAKKMLRARLDILRMDRKERAQVAAQSKAMALLPEDALRQEYIQILSNEARRVHHNLFQNELDQLEEAMSARYPVGRAGQQGQQGQSQQLPKSVEEKISKWIQLRNARMERELQLQMERLTSYVDRFYLPQLMSVGLESRAKIIETQLSGQIETLRQQRFSEIQTIKKKEQAHANKLAKEFTKSSLDEYGYEKNEVDLHEVLLALENSDEYEMPKPLHEGGPRIMDHQPMTHPEELQEVKKKWEGEQEELEEEVEDLEEEVDAGQEEAVEEAILEKLQYTDPIPASVTNKLQKKLEATHAHDQPAIKKEEIKKPSRVDAALQKRLSAADADEGVKERDAAANADEIEIDLPLVEEAEDDIFVDKETGSINDLRAARAEALARKSDPAYVNPIKKAIQKQRQHELDVDAARERVELEGIEQHKEAILDQFLDVDVGGATKRRRIEEMDEEEKQELARLDEELITQRKLKVVDDDRAAIPVEEMLEETMDEEQQHAFRPEMVPIEVTLREETPQIIFDRKVEEVQRSYLHAYLNLPLTRFIDMRMQQLEESVEKMQQNLTREERARRIKAIEELRQEEQKSDDNLLAIADKVAGLKSSGQRIPQSMEIPSLDQIELAIFRLKTRGQPTGKLDTLRKVAVTRRAAKIEAELRAHLTKYPLPMPANHELTNLPFRPGRLATQTDEEWTEQQTKYEADVEEIRQATWHKRTEEYIKRKVNVKLRLEATKRDAAALRQRDWSDYVERVREALSKPRAGESAEAASKRAATELQAFQQSSLDELKQQLSVLETRRIQVRRSARNQRNQPDPVLDKLEEMDEAFRAKQEAQAAQRAEKRAEILAEKERLGVDAGVEFELEDLDETNHRLSYKVSNPATYQPTSPATLIEDEQARAAKEAEDVAAGILPDFSKVDPAAGEDAVLPRSASTYFPVHLAAALAKPLTSHAIVSIDVAEHIMNGHGFEGDIVGVDNTIKATVISILQQSVKRFPHATYLITYPIFGRAYQDALLSACAQTGHRSILQGTFFLQKGNPLDNASRCYDFEPWGVGCVVIRPPPGFDKSLKDIVNTMHDVMTNYGPSIHSKEEEDAVAARVFPNSEDQAASTFFVDHSIHYEHGWPNRPDISWMTPQIEDHIQHLHSFRWEHFLPSYENPRSKRFSLLARARSQMESDFWRFAHGFDGEDEEATKWRLADERTKVEEIPGMVRQLAQTHPLADDEPELSDEEEGARPRDIQSSPSAVSTTRDVPAVRTIDHALVRAQKRALKQIRDETLAQKRDESRSKIFGLLTRFQQSKQQQSQLAKEEAREVARKIEQAKREGTWREGVDADIDIREGLDSTQRKEIRTRYQEMMKKYSATIKTTIPTTQKEKETLTRTL